MTVFGARAQGLHALIEEAGRRGALGDLAVQLDYNGFYSRQRRRQKQEQEQEKQGQERQQQGRRWEQQQAGDGTSQEG